MEEIAELVTNRHDDDRPANEWSVEETVEPAKDQEIQILVWVMGDHWLIR